MVYKVVHQFPSQNQSLASEALMLQLRSMQGWKPQTQATWWHKFNEMKISGLQVRINEFTFYNLLLGYITCTKCKDAACYKRCSVDLQDKKLCIFAMHIKLCATY